MKQGACQRRKEREINELMKITGVPAGQKAPLVP
jgi:hypothetical protein